MRWKQDSTDILDNTFTMSMRDSKTKDVKTKMFREMSRTKKFEGCGDQDRLITVASQHIFTMVDLSFSYSILFLQCNELYKQIKINQIHTTTKKVKNTWFILQKYSR